MRKYEYINFLVSDLHSFNKPFREALSFAGFDRKNKTHRLIILGDIFDRGPDTLGVYKYIKSLPKHRRVLIKGNHEQLYFMLLNKSDPDPWDFSNGTVSTFCQIAGIDWRLLDTSYYVHNYYRGGQRPDYEEIKAKIHGIWFDIRKCVRDHEITSWLKSDEWVDYFEFDKYICVHSFLPVTKTGYLICNWRKNATESDWLDSRWGCPWKQFNRGLFDSEAKDGKVLVCGHWHAEDFHRVYEHEYHNYNLYFGTNLIALDAMTPVSQQVNVLKITPDKRCFDQYGKELING